MKLVKNFASVVLLVFVLAFSAPAGEIGMPGAKPAPTPGANSSDEEQIAIYEDPSVAVVTAETSDYLFFEALAALLSVY